jgi:hypothetical protein
MAAARPQPSAPYSTPRGGGEVNGVLEPVMLIFVSLFALFLFACVLGLVWKALVGIWRFFRPPEQKQSLPYEPGLRQPLPPDQAREQLANELGSVDLLAAGLAPRLRERWGELLGRDVDEKDAREIAGKLAEAVFDRWAGAGGLAPSLRPSLPEQSWELPLEPEEFVEAWNRKTWLHGEGNGPLTLEEVRRGPFLSAQEFVDWHLDWSVWQLRQQTELNCVEIGCLPVFVTGIVTVILADTTGVPWWLGLLAGAAVVAVLALPYRRLRHRGYIGFGDD